ncbi:MAG: DNA recombination protein RmuC [Bacteroidetes bacterium]|nr:DNA recombination protein RmuC [Bacteroidota bacterium]
MEILIVVSVFVAVITIVIIRYITRQKEQTPESLMFFQQQLDTLRNEMQQALKNTTDIMSTSLHNTTTMLFQQLNSTKETVNQQLQIVTTQLGQVTQQIQNNTGQVGQRLDTAARVIQEVQGKLGELGKATQEIKELGQSVSKLEEMLRAPKLRGGLGELLLEDLLKQVLPANAYEVQYTFRNGQKVDAIIRTSGGIVPVDAKFPLENFRRMVEAKTEVEKKTAVRQFRADVRKHIDVIAEKYIHPDEGTFDFAMMYIPAENIYYETIIREETFDTEDGLYTYATQRHVVPVSPNTFYAHLRIIALGLKGMQIEQSARQIVQTLGQLQTELQKFTDIFETLGTHLVNAKNKYDQADKQLNTIAERLKVAQLPSKSSPEQLNLTRM